MTHRVVTGDARRILANEDLDQFELVFTSPP